MQHSRETITAAKEAFEQFGKEFAQLPDRLAQMNVDDRAAKFAAMHVAALNQADALAALLAEGETTDG